MKLSDRLQIIADEIRQNQTMADIGTDHGFLPVYLWEKGISPKVIMTDISAGSLEKAARNCRKRYPDVTFDLRLGNGIQVLSEGEVDAVVLAGMGGVLITEILGEDLKKSRSFQTLILQPRTGQGVLRHWLIHNGFGIIRESLVREGKYICEVITACPLEQTGQRRILSQSLGCGGEAMPYETPPWIFTAGALAEPFVQYKLETQKKILRQMNNARTEDAEKRRQTEQKIEYLVQLLNGRKES